MRRRQLCRRCRSLLGRLLLVVHNEFCLGLVNFCRRHHRKRIDQVLPVELGELVDIRHLDAFGRTRIHAQAAIAAFRDIDVEAGNIQTLLGPHRRETQIDIRRRFNGLDLNAIHRARHRALVAPDAVVDVDVQTVAGTLRELGFDIRILYGDGRREEMLPRHLHSDQHGHQTVVDITKIAAHSLESIHCDTIVR